MATVAELAVNVVARTGGVQRGLRQAEGSLSRFSSTAKGIAAGIASAFSIITVKKMVTDFAALGDQLDKMSARTGVAVESLSALGFAAEQSGADLETLEKGLFGLSRAVFDFGRGSAEVSDAFDQLGLGFRELQGLSPEQQLMAIADALQQFEDASTRGAIAQKIFGRSGRQLLPLLANGSRGINELTDEAEKLGITLSSDDAKAAAEFTDAMNRLSKSLRAIGTQVAKTITPMLTALADVLTSMGPELQAATIGAGAFTGAMIIAAPAIRTTIDLVKSLTAGYRALATAQTAASLAPAKGAGAAAGRGLLGRFGGRAAAGGAAAAGAGGVSAGGLAAAGAGAGIGLGMGLAGFAIVDEWAKRGFHTITADERAMNRLGSSIKGLAVTDRVSVGASGGFSGGTLIRLGKKQNEEQITSNSLMRQQNEILEGIRQQQLRPVEVESPIRMAAGF